jgi:HAD superfamily hydrolase (TIGR01549 family)
MPSDNFSDISTIIWDLDGTLLDSLGILEEGLAKVLPSYGWAVPSHDVMLDNFHGSLEESINNALGGVGANELQIIVQDFLVVQDKEYETVEHHLFPDAVDLARRAHGQTIRQILVTNRAHEGRLKASPRHIVAHSSLRDYIDLVICGDDSQHRKPYPAVLGEYAAMIDASSVLVVGDQHVDAEFAHNIGARVVIVDRRSTSADSNERLREHKDNIIMVNSLNEVIL